MAVIIKLTTLEDEEGITFPLFEAKVIIGRSKSCDIILKDLKVSSQHCSLFLNTNGLVLFRDLESTNGSFIFEEKITTPYYLKIGEKIRIGETFISIDRSQLNAEEIKKIGLSEKVESLKDKNIENKPTPNTEENEQKTQTKAKGIKPSTKNNAIKTVDLYKPSIMLDQEESSGHTKFLKIEKAKKKKK